ncbi:unnamed protein product [Pylaiella littoralis]
MFSSAKLATQAGPNPCENAPARSHGRSWLSMDQQPLSRQDARNIGGERRVFSGGPMSYRVWGVADSAKPFIDVGDVTLHVKVVGPTSEAGNDGQDVVEGAEFELDLCTDVVGVDCPLAVGDKFSGVVTWNAFVLPRGLHEHDETLTVTVIQPEGPACGRLFDFVDRIQELPVEKTGDLLDDHLGLMLEAGFTSTWTRGYSPRFLDFSWEDARRIAGGTVMRGQLGFEELPRRTHAKAKPKAAGFMGANADGPVFSEKRRLIAKPDNSSGNDIPANFDGREAFPECASVIGRVRDQSDCGSCWAFASTEAFNDRRCISGIGKEDSASGGDGDQLLVLSAEDTTACCYGFHCGLSMGCNGGQPGSAWEWFTRTGVVSGGDYGDIGTGTTCKPYEFMPCAHHVDPGASGYPACPSDEYPTPACRLECSEDEFGGGTYEQDKKMASEAYSLRGVEDIQLDMMKYGSVTAAFSVHSDFLTYSGGVYSNKSGTFLGGHAVKIIGWGTDEDSGEDYWLVVNSWNPSWGEGGLFRILRGVDECGIEGQIVTGEV